MRASLVAEASNGAGAVPTLPFATLVAVPFQGRLDERRPVYAGSFFTWASATRRRKSFQKKEERPLLKNLL
jgi:hypothetical protein